MGKFRPWLLLLIAATQICLTTYALWLPWSAGIPVLFCLNGLLFTALLVQQPALSIHINPRVWMNPWKWVLLFAGMVYSYQLARTILDKTPLSIEHADMLPIIHVMGKRFLAGHWQEVYTPIAEIWNGIQPIYLPAMWLPFTLADIFHFDLRWVTVGGVWIGVIVIVLQSGRFRSISIWLVLAVLSVLLWWLHTEERNNLFRLTEEGVVIAYHVLLVLAIVYRRPVWLGIAISACLLSRYVLITAVPAVLLWWVLQRDWQVLIRSVLTVLVCCLLTIACFGLAPFEQMMRIPGTYIQHAVRVWQEHPEYFSYTPGMAAVFGPDKIVLQHQLLLLLGFGMPLLFSVLMYWFYRKQTIANMELAIATLAITVFYTLVDVPYLYLYYTPVFWYLAIAALALKQVESKSV